MIPNSEFKHLSIYPNLMKQLEFKDKFDRYSICKNFYDLLDTSRHQLFKDLGYDNKNQLIDLLDNVEVIEISDSVVKFGNENAHITFMPNGYSFKYTGYFKKNYKRKLC